MDHCNVDEGHKHRSNRPGASDLPDFRELSAAGFIAARYTHEVLMDVGMLAGFCQRTRRDMDDFRVAFNGKGPSGGDITETMLTG